MAIQNRYLEFEQKMVGDIYTSFETMDNLLILCDEFGSRFGGTEGERQAAEYMVGKLKEYGLENAKLEEFDYYGWIRGPASLQVASPLSREVPCISLPYSPPADLEASLVNIKEGTPAEFERLHEQIAGKIVMANTRTPQSLGRWMHRSEKYNRSVVAGAVGFIWMQHLEGLGPETGSITGNREALIPGVSVAKEWGDFLARILEKKGEIRLRLKTQDETRLMKSWNVVAELKGRVAPDEMVVIGAHYDGHDISQGAEDPASGTVVVLEAARVLAKIADRLERTVRFIAFGNEETGLIGSREYVKAHMSELSKMRFMLNLDSAGGARSRKGIVLNSWPELDSFFRDAAKEMGAMMPVGQKTSAFSDHYPFFLEGVPTGSMGDTEAPQTGRGFGHTHWDMADKVHISNLREAAANVARVVLRIANEKDWPASRRDLEAVQTLLDKEPGLPEVTKLRGQIDEIYEKKGLMTFESMI
ncbi:MAG: M28 family peptidase [Candidatus Tectomicrobia bacterium]|nr:M28 family peptidase [Candidatus Tectomicrobia bacterium]